MGPEASSADPLLMPFAKHHHDSRLFHDPDQSDYNLAPPLPTVLLCRRSGYAHHRPRFWPTACRTGGVRCTCKPESSYNLAVSGAYRIPRGPALKRSPGRSKLLYPTVSDPLQPETLLAVYAIRCTL